ncbi:uncharacterized protein LOC108676456 [Hyalella azteca]|uniref:Uncharacterized protein LOC108676456 n=1 Tax=Hyalella azteca TaxID=294128 RepID=A0A8B7P1X8_HYAAZ|nr:uncharacterized protein LOC108676456 [Hyalella azteca]
MQEIDTQIQIVRERLHQLKLDSEGLQDEIRRILSHDDAPDSEVTPRSVDESHVPACSHDGAKRGVDCSDSHLVDRSSGAENHVASRKESEEEAFTMNVVGSSFSVGLIDGEDDRSHHGSCYDTGGSSEENDTQKGNESYNSSVVCGFHSILEGISDQSKKLGNDRGNCEADINFGSTEPHEQDDVTCYRSYVKFDDLDSSSDDSEDYGDSHDVDVNSGNFSNNEVLVDQKKAVCFNGSENKSIVGQKVDLGGDEHFTRNRKGIRNQQFRENTEHSNHYHVESPAVFDAEVSDNNQVEDEEVLLQRKKNEELNYFLNLYWSSNYRIIHTLKFKMRQGDKINGIFTRGTSQHERLLNTLKNLEPKCFLKSSDSARILRPRARFIQPKYYLEIKCSHRHCSLAQKVVYFEGQEDDGIATLYLLQKHASAKPHPFWPLKNKNAMRNKSRRKLEKNAAKVCEEPASNADSLSKKMIEKRKTGIFSWLKAPVNRRPKRSSMLFEKQKLTKNTTGEKSASPVMLRSYQRKRIISGGPPPVADQ